MREVLNFRASPNAPWNPYVLRPSCDSELMRFLSSRAKFAKQV
jgi:chorismate mutase